MYYLGPHVSAAGGVHHAPQNARVLGASAFALFVKNQRQWSAPPLPPSEITAFKEQMKACGYVPEQVLPHAGYLLNLANPDDRVREQSRVALMDEMMRCRQLGLTCLNFHPGSHLKLIAPETACKRVAEAMNAALREVPDIRLVVENTAGSGGHIGSRFEELAILRDGIDDTGRIGFCLDTAHTFAAGYDIRTRDGFLKTMELFDRQVGLHFLRGLHLNDSKTGFNAHVDRHASIGKGLLGLEVFPCIMQDKRFEDIPLILETPDESLWAEEIRLLQDMATRSPGI